MTLQVRTAGVDFWTILALVIPDARVPFHTTYVGGVCRRSKIVHFLSRVMFQVSNVVLDLDPDSKSWVMRPVVSQYLPVNVILVKANHTNIMY